uniref:Non-structural protein 3b n=1 Tax=Bird gammacoronavirus AnasCN24 TaxID=3237959 RepID=A0AB39ACW8_9GAMC
MLAIIENGFKTVCMAGVVSVTIDALLSTSLSGSQFQQVMLERGEDAMCDASRIAHLISLLADCRVYDPFAEAFYCSGSFWEIDSMEEDGSILASDSDIDLY